MLNLHVYSFVTGASFIATLTISCCNLWGNWWKSPTGLTVGFFLVSIASRFKKAFCFMSLTDPALDSAICPNRWMLAVVPPNVLSASSFVAVFPSNAFFLSSPQWFHKYSDPDINRYLYTAFFLSCSSVHMALAAVLNEMKEKFWVSNLVCFGPIATTLPLMTMTLTVQDLWPIGQFSYQSDKLARRVDSRAVHSAQL